MAENWKEFRTWHLVLPPNRPTVKFLDLVRCAVLATGERSAAAVLGSTPEVRDLLSACGVRRICVFERDIEFYNMMTTIKGFGTERETLVAGDWLETLFHYENTFDFVVADLVSGNVPYDRRSDLYTATACALREGGLFIDRALVYDFPLFPLATLDAKYERLPANLRTYNDFSSEYLFLSELLEGSDVVDSSRFYDTLAKRHMNHPYLTLLREGAHLITPRGATWYYGRPWSELQAQYSSPFGTTQMFDDEPGTVFSGKVRIFQSRKGGAK